MKAELDENGVLTVSAENPLESYALRKWITEVGNKAKLIDGREYLDSSSLLVCTRPTEEGQ